MDISLDVGIDIEEAVEYIYKELQTRARAAGKWAADELTMEATKAMFEFYGSYSPEMYDRSGGLLNSYKRYYTNKHGNIIYGGVELKDSTSSYHSSLNPDKGVDSAFVTSLAWFAGRHGFTEAFPFHVNNYPPVMSPTPDELLWKKQKEVEAGILKFF